jgi:hypothetical protein
MALRQYGNMNITILVLKTLKSVLYTQFGGITRIYRGINKLGAIKTNIRLMDEHQYLITQLNLIVGFIEVSDEKVFEQIKQHDRFGLGVTIDLLYQSEHSNYSNHILTSALILGFAHFEEYMYKCIVKLLVKNPKKNKCKVALSYIIEKGDTLIRSLAEDEAKRLTFSEKVKFLENNLKGIDLAITEEIKFVNNIRNCIIHNGGLADERLKPIFEEGKRIILTSGQINGYGLKVRRLADEIWKWLDCA